MARLFDDANSQRLSIVSVPFTTVPCSIGGWFYPDDTANVGTIGAVLDSGGANNGFSLTTRGDIANDPVQAITWGAVTASAQSTTFMVLNAWNYALAVFTSSVDRTIYLNGAAGVVNTTDSGAVGTPNTTGVGALPRATPIHYMSGRLAAVGFWNAALNANEAAALYRGVNPRRIRPASLAACYQIRGLLSPEPDETSGNRSLTLSASAPTLANHAPVEPYTPRWSSIFDIAAAQGGGGGGGSSAASIRYAAWRDGVFRRYVRRMWNTA